MRNVLHKVVTTSLPKPIRPRVMALNFSPAFIKILFNRMTPTYLRTYSTFTYSPFS